MVSRGEPRDGAVDDESRENPQVPFSELKIHLNGGPRAPLDNPAVCGPATTTTDFTPWSAPGITPEGLSMPGTPDATPSSFFEVEGCAAARRRSAPGFVAGTVTPQAGQFSAFTLNFSRQDREQYVKGIQIHTPPGLLGMLSSVPLCGEPRSRRRALPGSVEDRHDAGRVRRRLAPVRNRRERVPDRPVRGRAVRAERS